MNFKKKDLFLQISTLVYLVIEFGIDYTNIQQEDVMNLPKVNSA